MHRRAHTHTHTHTHTHLHLPTVINPSDTEQPLVPMCFSRPQAAQGKARGDFQAEPPGCRDRHLKHATAGFPDQHASSGTHTVELHQMPMSVIMMTERGGCLVKQGLK